MKRIATIPEALLATAERGGGEYVFHLVEGTRRMSCVELAERAQVVARRLVALGVEPGDTVGVLGPNRPEWVVSVFAVWMAGAALAPLQVPVRIRDHEAFSESLRHVIDTAGCRLVLAERRLAADCPADAPVAWDETGGGADADPPGAEAGGAAVIQFTSGSTASPRGALITHAAAIAQMEVLGAMVSGEHGPRTLVSWVPFFHDMGLFLSALAPAIWGARAEYLPTERFARDPIEWLKLIEASRATLTLAPSAAFGSTLRALSRYRYPIDLSSLELALLVAEAVEPGVAKKLTEAGPQLSLGPEALGSGYGLAEAVLAVAYSPAGAGLRLDRVSLPDLTESGVAAPAESGRSRTFASCGPPRVDLRIVGPESGTVPERRIGEIQVRGPSLMSRYIGADPTDPFDGRWLHTGDLGYLADGELYVTGRLKDMMISLGHNYYPEDFEWAAGRVDGIRPGRCVAFNLPGTEEVVVLAETNQNGGSQALAREARRAISDAVGVRPSEVVLLPANTVQKTTSGKLRRAAMRDLYVSGTLEAAG